MNDYLLNEINRQRIFQLLRLIRHRGRLDPKVPHDYQSCGLCNSFDRIAKSHDEWPWRDYKADPPKAGDL